MQSSLRVALGKSRRLVRFSLACPLCGIAPPPHTKFEPSRAFTVALAPARTFMGSARRIDLNSLGSWGTQVDISAEDSVRYGTPVPQFCVESVGTSSHQGRRPANEDRLDVQMLTNDVVYFAVFDGHGGPEAATTAHEKLPVLVKDALEEGQEDLVAILQSAFKEVESIIHHRSRTFWKRQRGGNPHSGTTATVCLLRRGMELVVSHVGDSRAVLCRGDLPLRLSTDDVLEDDAERQRVLASGGRVLVDSVGIAKVNGRLSMTRSLGDVDMKLYGVTAEPHIAHRKIRHHKDSFIVLTTDGINFVMSDAEVMRFVKSQSTPAAAAELLTDLAMEFNSSDNATALVVPLGSWGSGWDSKGTPFGRQLSSAFERRS